MTILFFFLSVGEGGQEGGGTRGGAQPNFGKGPMQVQFVTIRQDVRWNATD